jgi:glucokinase
MADRFLGIEIGGTKLQLAVGTGDGSALDALERLDVDRAEGAARILRQIEDAARKLLAGQRIERIGIGFGGPVQPAAGLVTTSHQVAGWERFPLVAWCLEKLGLPTVLANDCDAAALAEARFGAGRGRRSVFFVTVGTGIGGGLVLDGQLYGGDRPAVAEIGHLRPGLEAEAPERTIESLAAGPAIEAGIRQRISEAVFGGHSTLELDDLERRSAGAGGQLTACSVAEAAAEGNTIARGVMLDAVRALGWAIAQAVTLVAPEVVVVGGGVSLADPAVFLQPLREAAARYVFPPLAGSFEIVPAELGELVVVQGALALAAGAV